MPKRAPVDGYTSPVTKGIDVSKWQGEIDWTILDKDIKFVFVRSGDGTGVDSFFDRNWRGAESSARLVGSYRYLRADRDGKTQAELDCDLLRSVGFTPGRNLPPVLDLEAGSRKDLPGGVFTDPSSDEYIPLDLFVEESLEYLEILEQELLVRPIVYTGQAFHWWLSQARPDLAEKFAKYPLWVPSYNKSVPDLPVDRTGTFGFPWPTWTFWQYTAQGRVFGIAGDVDLNFFRGDFAALSRFAQESAACALPAAEEDSGSSATTENLKAALDELRHIFDSVGSVKAALKELVADLDDAAVNLSVQIDAMDDELD